MSLKFEGVFLDCLTPRMEVMWYDAVRMEEGKPWVLFSEGIWRDGRKEEGVSLVEKLRQRRERTYDVDVISIDSQDPLVSTNGSLPLNGVLLEKQRDEDRKRVNDGETM